MQGVGTKPNPSPFQKRSDRQASRVSRNDVGIGTSEPSSLFPWLYAVAGL